MKKSTLILLIIIAYLFSMFTAGFMGYTIRKFEQEEKLNVDWPEEIQALSTDQNTPDTMLGYQSNGKIYMRFKH